MSKHDEHSRSLVAVSCPGGPARQFRVQVASGETPSTWKLVECFGEAAKADQCADKLTRDGLVARIVACTSLPTAA